MKNNFELKYSPEFLNDFENINNYIIFYTVSNNEMKVRRFIYAKRDLDKLI